MKNNSQRGSVLLAVVLALSLIAAVALLLNRGGGMNLESSARQEMGDVARAAAEAGLNHTVWQLQQANCTDYVGLTDEPFGSTAYQNQYTPVYTTSVTPDNGSPVLVKAKGILQNNDTTNELSRLATVYESTTIVNLQPDAADGKDTYVNEQSKRRNYGASTQIGVDSGGAHDYFALLEFNLADLLGGLDIHSATLELYLESFGSTNQNAKFTLYRMTQAWTEGTGDGSQTGDGATKDTSDGSTSWTWPDNYDKDNPVTVTPVNPGFSGWHSWEIKPLVQGWQDGIFVNNGLVIIGNNQVRDAFFAASDHADPDLRPRLKVEYICVCGGGPEHTITLQLGTDPGKDANVDSFYADRNFGRDYGRVSGPPSTLRHQLYFFDLSTIPSEAPILSAELGAYAYWVDDVGPGMAITAHQLTRDWIEGTGTGGGTADGVTWNTYDGVNPWAAPGGDFDPLVLASAPVLTNEDQWFSWFITPLVSQWVTQPSTNQGVLLKGEGDLEVSLADTDYNVPAQKPKLTITYSCPCGIDCTGTAEGGGCGDFIPPGIVSEFSTAAIGSGKPHGLTYLPEGKIFLGVAAPAGGAWLIVDWNRDLYMTTLSGSLLTSCTLTSLNPSTLAGITLVQSGTWADHLAIAGMQLDDEVAFVDLNCNVISSFPTLPFGSYTPTGLGFIGTTASGSYEEHLAVADYFNDAVYIIDQAGALQATLDLSAFIGQVHGVSHLPGTDKLLLADEEMGHTFIIDFVNFSGTFLKKYDAAPFGTGAPTAAAINPLTCDHMLGDETAEKVVALNIGGTPPSSLTLNSVADTWIYMNDPDTNFGSNPLMQDGANAGWDLMHSMVEFDLSTIPAGATVQTATLRLYVDGLTGNQPKPMGLYQVTADWAEGTQTGSGTADGATWNTYDGLNPWATPGGDFDPAPLTVPTIDWSVGWKEWDVPPGLIHEWIDGVSLNYGLLLYYQGDKKNFFLKFATKEHSDPSLHPQLVIEYIE